MLASIAGVAVFVEGGGEGRAEAGSEIIKPGFCATSELGRRRETVCERVRRKEREREKERV